MSEWRLEPIDGERMSDYGKRYKAEADRIGFEEQQEHLSYDEACDELHIVENRNATIVYRQSNGVNLGYIEDEQGKEIVARIHVEGFSRFADQELLDAIKAFNKRKRAASNARWNDLKKKADEKESQ